MNILFVHDHVFGIGPDGQVYSPGKLPAGAWGRYLVGDARLEVLARGAAGTEVDMTGWSLSSRKEVNFSLLTRARGLYLKLMWPWSRERAAIRRLLEKSNAAIIRLPSRLGHGAIVEARRLGVPYAVEVVGCAMDSLRTSGPTWAKFLAPYGYYEMRRDVSGATHALYVTSRFLQARYPMAGRTAAISNVVLSKIGGDPAGSYRQRCFQRNNEKAYRIGFVGVASLPYKGFAVLVRAVSHLRRVYGINASVEIAGTEDLEPVKDLLRKHGMCDAVVAHGVLPKQRLDGWYSALDIFVCPSLTEGLPRALIEAMAHGLPCVGSSVGGVTELLEGGRIYRPGDARALSKLLCLLLSDPEMRVKDSIRNYEFSANFEGDVLERRRLDFWREFIQSVAA